MKPAHKYLACLIAFVLPLSVWAETGKTCAEIAATEESEPAALTDVHAHHNDSNAAGVGTDSDADPSACPCCDDCEASCFLSGCSPGVLSKTSDRMTFMIADTHLKQSLAYRDGPPPHVLFRPPILSV